MIIRDHHDRAPSGGRLLGACAGMAHRTGVPAIAWRIGRVIAMLCVSFKLTTAAYCVAAPTLGPEPR